MLFPFSTWCYRLGLTDYTAEDIAIMLVENHSLKTVDISAIGPVKIFRTLERKSVHFIGFKMGFIMNNFLKDNTSLTITIPVISKWNCPKLLCSSLHEQYWYTCSTEMLIVLWYSYMCSTIAMESKFHAVLQITLP